MIWNMPEEDWDAVIQIHLKSVFNMSTHAARVMREQRYGRIISMCSEAWKGTIGQANYGAAKGAIWSFTAMREAGRYGVTRTRFPAATRLTVTDDVKQDWETPLVG
jgi:3-oxoacyl-[acyl-carrier protein] reductase